MADQRGRVTILSEYFYPENASTAQLLTELSTRLAETFDVTALTAQPNYHEKDRVVSAPRSSHHKGVAIERVRATRFDKDRLSLRAVNWLSFTVLAFVRLLRVGRRSGVLLVLSNPPILPFLSLAYKHLTGTPYIYLVHDIYPEFAVELGLLSEEGLIARVWSCSMRFVYRDADRIVVLGEAMRARIESKMDGTDEFDADRIKVIPNWEDGTFIEPVPKTENKFAKDHETIDDFTVVYSGNIGRYHDIETTIDAIGLLEDQGRTDVQLLIIGDGAEKERLVEYVDQENIENVRFLQFQPKERLPETLTCGDASLVGVRPDIAGLCVSSKLYSALAAGQPILATVGEDDDVARTVVDADAGEVVEPGRAEEVAEVLGRWADDPATVERLGSNAREGFEERFTIAHAVADYADLFEEVVGEEADV